MSSPNTFLICLPVSLFVHLYISSGEKSIQVPYLCLISVFIAIELKEYFALIRYVICKSAILGVSLQWQVFFCCFSCIFLFLPFFSCFYVVYLFVHCCCVKITVSYNGWYFLMNSTSLGLSSEPEKLMVYGWMSCQWGYSLQHRIKMYWFL